MQVKVRAGSQAGCLQSFSQCLLKEVASISAIPRTHLGASVSHLQMTNDGYSPGLSWNFTEASHDPQGS